MHRNVTAMVCAATLGALVLGGCSVSKSATSTTSTSSSSSSSSSDTSGDSSSGTSTTAAVAAVPFDTSTLPTSTATLGADLPYLALPATIKLQTEDKLADFDTPFWVGTGFHVVTGTTWQSFLRKADTADTVPNFPKEVAKAVTALGGTVVVQDSTASSAYLDALPETTTSALNTGYGSIKSSPVTTWVIRTPSKTVWVQLCLAAADNGSLLVTDENLSSSTTTTTTTTGASGTSTTG